VLKFKRTSVIFLFIFLIAPIPFRAQSSDRYFIGNIPLTYIQDESSKSGYLLFPNDAERLYEILKINRGYDVLKKSDSVFIISQNYRFMKSVIRGTEPSFLIDYDDAVFINVKKDMEMKLKTSPLPLEIANYTYKYIINKNYKRVFDSASIVVKRKEGDCTEHTVLYVALLRMFGFPARVVLGVVVFDDGKSKGAFGHAWAEYRNGEKWEAFDPTLNREVDSHYIPIHVFENEGMDYHVSMMRNMNGLPVKIHRVN
jgi:hypothetical protein